MKNIEFSNCMQVIGIIGILPNRVCGSARSNKLMDLQISNNFPSEIEGAESEEGDISETEGAEFETIGWVDFEGGGRDGIYNISFRGAEMLKWFNHQSVDNSIFFFVGRKFPKLAVCIVVGQEGFYGFVDISINGYESRGYKFIDPSGNNLCLFSPTQRSLRRHLNESNPTDQNLVEVSITYSKNGYSVKRWGVHVECTCSPQEDDAVD